MIMIILGMWIAISMDYIEMEKVAASCRDSWLSTGSGRFAVLVFSIGQNGSSFGWQNDHLQG